MMKNEAAAPISTAPRLLSIDALRGFDMFWIIGGDTLFKVLAQRVDEPAAKWVDEQLDHVPWEGFHFYDLIYPLFLFIVGVVLPFSLSQLRDRGVPKGTLYRRIIQRTILLFVLGLVCNRFLQFNFDHLRVAGVLQRIALCYGIAGLIVLNTRAAGQLLAAVVLLLGYWAILAYVPAPGSHAGDYSIEGNLGGYVDRHYLPGRIVKEYYGFGDNEGILSTFPAVATALLGALAGQWLRSNNRQGIKVLGLMAAGALSFALGTYWGQYFPIIKNLWTSSFVLVAGGWSLLLLGFFYLIIDVIGWRRWAFFFVVIGSNAITIYVLRNVVDFEHIARFFFGGVYKHSGGYLEVVESLAVIIVEWLFLWFLYRKRIFLRV